MLRLNKPGKWYLVVGCISSILIGGTQAAVVIVYTEMYDIFPVSNHQERLDRISVICAAFGGLAALRLVCYTLNEYAFGVAGGRLTTRCRILLFESILKQEVEWFDRPENQPGSLTGRLAGDVPTLQNMTGRRLASMMEILVLIASSLCIAFYFGSLMQTWSAEVSRKSLKGASLAQEVFSASKTVSALQAGEYIVGNYVRHALLSNSQILKGVAHYALANAITNSFMGFEISGVFYLGGILLQRGDISMLQLWRSFSAIGYAASNLGYAESFAPDTKKASKAAKAILDIIHRHPQLRPHRGDFADCPFTENIVFNNVRFRYPICKQIPVPKFTSVCAKFDHFTYPFIRQQIGVVSQEPNLLDLTIRENIAYGLNHQFKDRDDITSGVSMEAILEAGKQANAHDFISSLPKQHETATRVGSRGSRLSGGQKQRIANAKASARDLRLLVLDKAIAALDNEGERLVQTALDEVMQKGGRTCLVVAHRLTTVEACDLVVVLERGKAVEWGTPNALLETKGAYYAPYNAV
ncbi:Phosphatidylcholine translocator ABCB4 [Taenia crassiceps]|uniref:Phosphatidylcholine translocator ABCB4 n=1 Tax=Taenia crassiceps TaxID=6207 RepID=A0ABR4QFJ2_9CEST